MSMGLQKFALGIVGEVEHMISSLYENAASEIIKIAEHSHFLSAPPKIVAKKYPDTIKYRGMFI